MLEKKPWGYIKSREIGENMYIDKISIQSGGFSSTHKHIENINIFFVLSGVIYIKSEIGLAILKAGQSYTVQKGIFHRFFCAEDAEVIEVYFGKKDIEVEIERLSGKGNGLHRNGLYSDFIRVNKFK